MKISKSLRLALVGLALIGMTGCVIAPGSHIGYDDTESSTSLEERVDIEPITPELIRNIEEGKRRASRMSDKLREQIDSYNYFVGEGDVLSIIVYGHPELTIPAGTERSAVEAGHIVRPNGTIYYPFLGRIRVAGKTVDQIRLQLRQGLSAYLTDPQVDVLVAQFNSQKAYIAGSINTTDTLPITNVPTTILDAISAAGGLTSDAYWHELNFIRGGEKEKISLFALLSQGDQTENRLLKDGDQLYIPSADNEGVAMLGQVRSPGNLRMNREPLSLTAALSRAGGINEDRGEASGIFVMRPNPLGSEKLATVYQLDASDATAYTMGSNFPLMPDDIVYVTTAPLARWNRVISQLLPSLTLPGDISSGGDSLEDLL